MAGFNIPGKNQESWLVSIYQKKPEIFSPDIYHQMMKREEIQCVEVDPYEFTIEETGEVFTLTHRSKYNPKPMSVSTEETVF